MPESTPTKQPERLVLDDFGIRGICARRAKSFDWKPHVFLNVLGDGVAVGGDEANWMWFCEHATADHVLEALLEMDDFKPEVATSSVPASNSD